MAPFIFFTLRDVTLTKVLFGTITCIRPDMAYLCVNDFLHFLVAIPVLTTPEYYPTAWTFQNFSKKKNPKIILTKKYMYIVKLNLMSICKLGFRYITPWKNEVQVIRYSYTCTCLYKIHKAMKTRSLRRGFKEAYGQFSDLFRLLYSKL